MGSSEIVEIFKLSTFKLCVLRIGSILLNPVGDSTILELVFEGLDLLGSSSLYLLGLSLPADGEPLAVIPVNWTLWL